MAIMGMLKRLINAERAVRGLNPIGQYVARGHVFEQLEPPSEGYHGLWECKLCKLRMVQEKHRRMPEMPLCDCVGP